MFLNSVQLAVLTLFISTTKLLVQSLLYINSTFTFSPFCFDIENIDTKMYLHGF